MRELRHYNTQLLKNILPDHVATFFLTSHVRNVEVRLTNISKEILFYLLYLNLVIKMICISISICIFIVVLIFGFVLLLLGLFLKFPADSSRVKRMGIDHESRQELHLKVIS